MTSDCERCKRFWEGTCTQGGCNFNPFAYIPGRPITVPDLPDDDRFEQLEVSNVKPADPRPFVIAMRYVSYDAGRNIPLTGESMKNWLWWMNYEPSDAHATAVIREIKKITESRTFRPVPKGIPCREAE